MKKQAELSMVAVIIISLVVLVLVTSLIPKIIKQKQLFDFHTDVNKICQQTEKSLADYSSTIENMDERIKDNPFDSKLGENLAKNCKELDVCFPDEYSEYEDKCIHKIGDEDVLNTIELIQPDGDSIIYRETRSSWYEVGDEKYIRLAGAKPQQQNFIFTDEKDTDFFLVNDNRYENADDAIKAYQVIKNV